MRVFQTIYHQAVRFAEGGARLTRVVLPEPLYAEYINEGFNVHRMLNVCGIEVKKGKGLTEPQFFCEKDSHGA
jgi:hypothetical protein